MAHANSPRTRVLTVITAKHVQSVTGWSVERCRQWIAQNGDDLRQTLEDSAIGILEGTLHKEIRRSKKD